MSGIQTKAADVTVLAPEGATSLSAGAGRAVYGGGLRRSRQLALRRRDLLHIPHGNDNAPSDGSRLRLQIVAVAPTEGSER